ncbi:sialidase family protein [Paenibacillus chitinolyticus]|uniref:sialidase family protein n=1 Tax=Paenibacillus chitinolyticus TaxID=79263 RepID=UPI001C43CF5C|nr:sialidase family protein [Paenibacillus chitinolyticus]MBV6712253.1 glycoside hydrolase [Paenibacillus chitinolyticus]
MANSQVSPAGTLAQTPSVAANYLTALNIVASATDFTTGAARIAVYRSVDQGISWGPLILPLPAGYIGGESNVVAYGFPNVFIVASHVFDAAGNGSIAVYTSTDNGITFGAPVIAAQGFTTFINNVQVNAVFDNSQVSTYQGSVYLVYVHQFNTDFVGGSVIFFQRSLDNGQTWLRPALVSPDADFVTRGDVVAGLTGIVYVAYISLTPFTRFEVSRSLDGGATFQTPVIVSPVTLVPSVLPVTGYGFEVPTGANIAVDNSALSTSGTLYAVWQDNRQGYADVFLSRSFDQGLTWTAPVSVTSAPAGTQNFFPSIDVSPKSGLVTILYYSNQIDGFDLDTYVAISADGGATFFNRRESTASSNPNAGSATPVPSIGNYTDISTIPPFGFIGVWTDTRTGTQAIFSGN